MACFFYTEVYMKTQQEWVDSGLKPVIQAQVDKTKLFTDCIPDPTSTCATVLNVRKQVLFHLRTWAGRTHLTNWDVLRIEF